MKVKVKVNWGEGEGEPKLRWLEVGMGAKIGENVKVKVKVNWGEGEGEPKLGWLEMGTKIGEIQIAKLKLNLSRQSEIYLAFTFLNLCEALRVFVRLCEKCESEAPQPPEGELFKLEKT